MLQETDRWYAVHCGPREEDKAARHLQAKGYKVFYPHVADWVEQSKRKARFVRLAYLSRYLFVCFTPERAHLESAYDVNETFGVSTIVYSGVDEHGDRMALPIPNEVMEQIMGLTDPCGQIHVTKKQRGNMIRVGDMVRFTDKNPLYGFLATVELVLKEGKELRVRLEKAIAGQTTMTVETKRAVEVIRA
jgi:transcription antitermination factor NusG